MIKLGRGVLPLFSLPSFRIVSVPPREISGGERAGAGPQATPCPRPGGR